MGIDFLLQPTLKPGESENASSDLFVQRLNLNAPGHGYEPQGRLPWRTPLIPRAASGNKELVPLLLLPSATWPQLQLGIWNATS